MPPDRFRARRHKMPSCRAGKEKAMPAAAGLGSGSAGGRAGLCACVSREETCRVIVERAVQIAHVGADRAAVTFRAEKVTGCGLVGLTAAKRRATQPHPLESTTVAPCPPLPLLCACNVDPVRSVGSEATSCRGRRRVPERKADVASSGVPFRGGEMIANEKMKRWK